MHITKIPSLTTRSCSKPLSISTKSVCINPKFIGRPIHHHRHLSLLSFRSNPAATTNTSLESETSFSEESTAKQESTEQFSFIKQWYPVAFTKFVDDTKPYPVTLLGNNLVIWKNTLEEEHTWQCFEDRCPHRSAPLSEGKVLPGAIQCSYHGWQFSTFGTCTKIPQSESKQAEERACKSPKSCVTSYPIQECQGLLWVWADPASIEESMKNPPHKDILLDEAQKRGDEIHFVIPPFSRIVPYDYATLVENVVDIAHVPFSHHGVQGNRDKVKYGEYEFKLVDSVAWNPLPTISAQYTSALFGLGMIVFEPPACVNLVSKRDDGTFSSFRIYSTPSSPGKAIILATLSTNRNLPFIFKLMKRLPSWLDHVLFRHAVLDGDNVLLHQQEQFLVKQAREQGKSWRDSFFMPTKADLVVAAFRNWLDSVAGGGPFGPLHQNKNYQPLITDKRTMLDRYHSHTQHCAACSKALHWVERFLFVSAVISCFGYAVAVDQGLRWLAVKGSVGVMKGAAAGSLIGCIGALAFYTLWRLKKMFYFVDYVHAER